jgi:penicillin-binding protein 2
MVKAMVALLNNGRVIPPHLLKDEESGKTVIPYRQPAMNADCRRRPRTGIWYARRCSAWPMRQTAPATSSSIPRLTVLPQKRHLQVFSLKENQTYNAKMIPTRLRDHILYRLCAV